jgi:SAM-dependent methyltransferase
MTIRLRKLSGSLIAMPDTLESTYDQVPYPSFAISATHPDVLAVEAMAAGMSPAPVERCRVLELGCASGGNLLPMAEQFPGSEFVGIDLSPVQIAVGQRLAAEAGIANARLIAADVTNLGGELGRFDYIIAHGLYTWVAPPVQEKVPAIYAELLTPQGVGYVSYDTYPGWHPRLMVRELLLYHTRGARGRADALEKARSVLRAIVATDGGAGNPNARIIREDANMQLSMGDGYIAHEPLAEHLEAIFFEQFAARLREQGLAYLAECRPHTARWTLAREVARQVPEANADRLALEQYVDYFMGSQFRRSAVVRAAAAPWLVAPHGERPQTWQLVERLPMRALCKPVGTIDLADGSPLAFDTGMTGTLTLTDGAAKALLVAVCGQWPRAVGFDAALELARRGSGPPALAAAAVAGSPEREVLARRMMDCRDAGALELRTRPMDFAVEAGPRPVASPLVRTMAETSDRLPCRLHFNVGPLNPVERITLMASDGTRDRVALATVIREAMTAGQLPPSGAGPAAAGAGLLESVERSVEVALRKLGRWALLLA